MHIKPKQPVGCLQFKDDIGADANSENRVVVCNDKYNSAGFYRISKSEGTVADVVSA